MAELIPKPIEDEDLQWILHVDGSSNNKSCGTGVVLEGSGDILLEQSLKFYFKNTNNQKKYEAVLVRFTLAYDVEGQQLICRSDS